MLTNRFIPNATVIPVLAYPNAPEAAAWLCAAFGFTIRIRIGTHRVQLNVGDGAAQGGIIVRELRPHEVGLPLGIGHSTHVRVEDVDAHYAHAQRQGARITGEPTTYPYGERQYVVEDPAGHSWTFTQSVADVNPDDWNPDL
jgi:uncharacterized glyoxalase superfamily protein PhnB